MERTQDSTSVKVALIDGPVALGHPDLAGSSIRELPGKFKGACSLADSLACMHGTFVAGVFCARQGSPAPSVCPRCTLLLRPIYAEATSSNGNMPTATPRELAEAFFDSVRAEANVIKNGGIVRLVWGVGAECSLHLAARTGHELATSQDRVLFASQNAVVFGIGAAVTHCTDESRTSWVTLLIQLIGKERRETYANRSRFTIVVRFGRLD
jgi:hypothetical protein